MPIQSNGKPLPRIILSRIGALDFTKIEFPQVMKVSFMLSELVINECDTSVIVGQTVVVDLQGTSLPLFAHAAPWVK